jgi:hypothetical protein
MPLQKQDSVITLEGFVGDSGLSTPECVESFQENDIVLHNYAIPQRNNSIRKEKEPTLDHPHPQLLLQIW